MSEDDDDDDGNKEEELGKGDQSLFLQLPTNERVKECYRKFYDATSNDALQSGVCGICARRLDYSESNISPYSLSSLPNVHRLIPALLHHDHTLYDGKLLEPQGVKVTTDDTIVSTCQDCFDSLKKPSNKPPQYSLANNMWVGPIPWQLQVLTIPEQLLIALLYPHLYIFKLFPKKMGGNHDTATLQCAMRGNVSTYELNMDGIASMIKGNMMPRPPTVLASVISVTFIGLGDLPKQWLRTTFRVCQQVVFEALQWLKENNKKYYGDIEINPGRIAQLPEDDVPLEVLGVMRQSTDTGIVDQESDGYIPMDDGGTLGEFDETIGAACPIRLTWLFLQMNPILLHLPQHLSHLSHLSVCMTVSMIPLM